MENEVVAAQYRLVKKRVVAYLNAKGRPGRPLGRDNLALLINSSDALAKLIDTDPEYEKVNLTARVFDTWISGDTSRGKRRYTDPTPLNLLAITEYLISKGLITRNEFETAKDNEAPAELLAQFLSPENHEHYNPSMLRGSLFAITESGTEITVHVLDFQPLNVTGAYSVSDLRYNVAHELGEANDVLRSRIAMTIESKDELRAYRTKSEWVGFSVMTDVSFLIAVRPLHVDPFKSSKLYYGLDLIEDDGIVSQFSALASKEQEFGTKLNRKTVYIQTDKLKFFKIHKNSDRILEEYEELVSRLPAKDKFMFASGDDRVETNILEEYMANSETMREIDQELILACNQGNAEAVRQLLQDGADPNCEEPKLGWKPIQVAAAAGAMEVLDILADIDELDVLVITKDGTLPSQLISHERLLPSELVTINKVQTRELREAEKRGVNHEDLLTRSIEVPSPI